MDILDKYKPTTLKDVIGNRLQIKKIQDFIKRNEPHILGIVGPSGSGKTTIANCIFKETNANILEVVSGQTIKEIVTSIRTFCTYKTIQDFMNPRKKIIFIDNIEVLMSQEKTIISALQDIVDLLKKYKIRMIITCRINEDKKLLDFKGDIDIIKIGFPAVKDTLIYLLDILEKEGYECDDTGVLEYITKNRGSIRESLIHILESNETQEDTRISNLFKDMNGFEIAKKLLHESYNFQEISYLIGEDISNVAFLMHENVVDELHNNKDLKTNNLMLAKEYSKILDNYIVSMEMEDFMYKTMDWSLYYLVNMLRVYGTIRILKDIPNKPTYKDLSYRYSQSLSKISHRNILNKKVKSIYDNKFNTIDLLYLTDKILKTTETKIRNKNKSISLEEHNLMNTYDKYFE